MKTVAVICGGYSKEKIISLKSAEQIVEAIDKSKYTVFNIFISREKWVALTDSGEVNIDKNDFSFLYKNAKVKFDAVFMAIHGTPGEDGKLQAYFEMIKLPVTTCNTFTSALTFNKYACKSYLSNFNILSAKAILVRSNDNYVIDDIIDTLGLPIFVKPNSGGSSFGISKVKEASTLKKAIEIALAEDDEVILEEFIAGREFTNGVFVSDKEEIVLPVTEIISKTEFFDFEAKYKGLSDEVTPADLSEILTNQCRELSLRIYKLLNCSGVVRIDYLLHENQFYFMEVNTVPGMSMESIIPQQVRTFGMTVSDFYSKLIDDAIIRGEY